MAFFAVWAFFCLLSIAAGVEVLLPAAGNTWDLDRVDTYQIFWKSHASDPTHVHIALHDGDDNVVDAYETVKTTSGAYLISGLTGITTGSSYRIVLSDSTGPNKKILGRSGKFSIRQVSGASSSGIAVAPYPATTLQPPVTNNGAASTSVPLANSTLSSSTTPQASSLTPAPISNSGSSATSGSSSSRGSSSSTGTSSQTSTGFPKFQDPTEKGLSKGAIAGIVIGVILLLLIIFGPVFFFWRKRRLSKRNEEPPAASAAHHGKAELVGDQARGVEQDPKALFTPKSELDTGLSPVHSKTSGSLSRKLQTAPLAMAELPQKPSTPAHLGEAAELPQQENPSLGSVQNENVVEIGAGPTFLGPGSSAEETKAELVQGAGHESEQQHFHLLQHQNAIELPTYTETKTSHEATTVFRTGDAPSIQPGTEHPRTPPAFYPPVAPLVSHLGTTTLPAPALALASASAPVSALAPLTPTPHNNPQEGDEADNEDEEEELEDLEALRRRQKALANSISAAEALERLRREHLKIEERIRAAEKAQRTAAAAAATAAR